jgi:hypothetical protein
MAYFPNGTSGMCYEEQFCSNCVHQNGPDGESGCAIWLLHMLYNYDQCGKGKTARTVKSFLGSLIPESKDGLGAEQCSMFAPKADAQAEEAERRRLAEQPAKYAAIMAERQAA